MSKIKTRKVRGRARRPPKPAPIEPGFWNVGARDLDNSTNVAAVTLNGFEIFRCAFAPDSYIEAKARQDAELLTPSPEEIAVAIKLLQEHDGIENPSEAEARQIYYGALREEGQEQAQIGANFISSHFAELCNLAGLAIIEAAKLATLKHKGRIDAETAREKILFSIWPFIRGMLDISGPGGDKKSTYYRAERKGIPQQRIDELVPLWAYIVSYRAECESEAGWYSDVMSEPKYKELSIVCPDLTADFIFKALRSTSDPSELALIHALRSESELTK